MLTGSRVTVQTVHAFLYNCFKSLWQSSNVSFWVWIFRRNKNQRQEAILAVTDWVAMLLPYKASHSPSTKTCRRNNSTKMKGGAALGESTLLTFSPVFPGFPGLPAFPLTPGSPLTKKTNSVIKNKNHCSHLKLLHLNQYISGMLYHIVSNQKHFLGSYPNYFPSRFRSFFCRP